MALMSQMKFVLTRYLRNVSKISSLHFVRNKMVETQRKYAKEKSIIVEGRDIGTVVFPKADFKFFLFADEKVRAKEDKKI